MDWSSARSEDRNGVPEEWHAKHILRLIILTIDVLQTPEEIERWCTKEDMSEVKRAVHLMKKGF